MASFNLVQFTKGLYRRSPPWFISGAICAILLAGSQVIYYSQRLNKADSTSTAVKLAASKDATEEVIQPPEIVDRKAVPKNEEAEIVDYEHETPEIFIPTAEEDLSLEHGDPTASENLPGGTTGGTAIGVGEGPGHYGTGKASPFGSRRLGSGIGKGRGGPTQGTEKAIREGLLWLVRHQLPDGNWSAKQLVELCIPESRCTPVETEYTDHHDVGLTGLALLAFLGAGYNFDSRQVLVDTVRERKHKVGEVVKQGLNWLRERQRDDGSFDEHQFMYDQALAALALSEAYGLSQNRTFKEPAQAAINWLLKAQKPNPSGQGLWGWRYRSRQDIERNSGETKTEDFNAELVDADTSVTTWVVMALKSADLSGLVVPHDSYEGARAFIDSVTGQNGLVGYLTADGAGVSLVRQPGRGEEFKYHVATMSSLGMLCRTFIDKNLDDPFLELGAKVLVKDLPTVTADKLSIDYYYWYYGSLALNQYDGPDSPHKGEKYWGPWNKAMTDSLLSLQDDTQKACTRGGWVTLDGWSYDGGPIYTTALNILTLEVYYRYENAFGAVRGGVKATAKPGGKPAGGGQPPPPTPPKDTGDHK
jgi:hypothetical protein